MKSIACSGCAKSCDGEVLKVDGKFFHPACFTCSECKVNLTSAGHELYSDEKGGYLCDIHFLKNRAPHCHMCHQIIGLGSVVSAFDMTFHQHCFSCSICRKEIKSGGKVTIRDNRMFVCEDCVMDAEDFMKRQGNLTCPAGGNTTGFDEDESVLKSATMDHPRKPADKFRARLQQFSFGKFYNTSYLQKYGGPEHYLKKNGFACDTNRRALSEDKTSNTDSPIKSSTPKISKEQLKAHVDNVRARSKETIHHLHRPEDLSFVQPSKKFVRKKGILKLVKDHIVRPEDRGIQMKTEDTIKASHYPSGHVPEDPETPQHELLPIERDDFPGPPCGALLIADKLRHKDEILGGPKKAASCEALDRADEDEEVIGDDRELMEIRKLAEDNSEIAHGLLTGLMKDCRVKKGSLIDPRSSSRVPNAGRQPQLPTRYTSAMFASPSRFTDHIRATNLGWPIDDLEAQMYSGVEEKNQTINALMPMSPGSGGMDHRDGDNQHHQRSNTLPLNLAPISTIPHLPTYLREQGLDPTTSSLKVKGVTVLLGDHPDRISVSLLSIDPQAGLQRAMDVASPTSPGGDLTSAPHPPIYPYDRLAGVAPSSLPRDVDIDHLENHLSDSDFERLFKVDRETFHYLPRWRQNDYKAKLHLDPAGGRFMGSRDALQPAALTTAN